MNSMLRRSAIAVLTIAMVVAAVNTHLLGYVAAGHTWGTNQVVYYVNPTNVSGLSEATAISAIQSAAAGWKSQTSANVQLVYGGTTPDASLALDYRNEVFFRNDSNGYIANTYWWYDGTGHLVDADIVFHEGAYKFFAFSGCDTGIYVEDVAIHEFGHALGLDHSQYSGVTMSAAMPGYCDQSQTTLEPDDISGIETLYPPVTSQLPAAPSSLSVGASSSNPSSALTLSWADNSTNESGFRVERSSDGASFVQIATLGAGTRSYTDSGLAAATGYYYRVSAYNSSGASTPSNTALGQTQAAVSPNTAPTVSVANPLSGSSYPFGTSITFSGSAIDKQDGDISKALTWTSSIDGQIGTGASFTRTLSAGTHTIRATATDTAGMPTTASLTMTVTASAQTAATLTASGSRAKGQNRVDLSWNGLTTATVDVYRNGTKVGSPSNSGAWTDSWSNQKGSFTYKACESTGSVCTNQATVSF